MSPLFNRSLFQHVREQISDDQAVFRAPKATLIDISHAIEDALLPKSGPSLLFAGFQESNFWHQEQDRYALLAASTDLVVVFATGEATVADKRHIHVALADGDPLRREWFVLTLTGRYAVMLAAIELDQPDLPEARRSFDAVYTFDPALIGSCADLLTQSVEHYTPDRAGALREALAQLRPVAPEGEALSKLMALLMSYSRNRQERLQRAIDEQRELRASRQALEQTLVEIAVPIIPIVPGVLVMPLVGNIDTRRSQQVMETLLEGIATHQADVTILDITGVPLVDTNVANNLIQAVKAANLLGAEVILTGIGADIAQTLVHLEVDFFRIQTRANLQAGIEAALALQGLQIRAVPTTDDGRRTTDDRRWTMDDRR